MSQFALKLIAMIAMLLDHTAAVVLKPGTLSPWVGMELESAIRTGMETVGRLAFPLFAWFAAEGCRRSGNPPKHLLRLFVFALLSEVPFQLCFYGGVSVGAHNVIFTLGLAVLAIYAARWLEQAGLPVPAARVLPAAVCVALGWFLHTDYNAWGVVLVICLYYLPEGPGRLGFLTLWCTVFYLLWHGISGGKLLWLTASGSVWLLYWIGSLTSVALLTGYNGQRGRPGKWLFYCFYPCHLALLYLAAAL